MKHLLVSSFVLALTCVVMAAEQPKLPTAWVYTTTTNEMNQVTKYASRIGTNGVEQIVYTMENGVEVPFKYRSKWATATKEEKEMYLSLVEPIFTDKKYPVPVLPVKKAPEDPTDEVITVEVRETRVRW